MSIVTIRQAKSNLSELIRQVAAREDVIIDRAGKPVARLVAIAEVKCKRVPGSLKGALRVGQEFFEPLSEGELSRWV